MVHQHFAKRLARQLGKSGKSNQVESSLEDNVDDEDENKPRKDKLNEWLTHILPNSANLNTNRFRLVATARLTPDDLVNSENAQAAADASKMSFSEHFFSSNEDASFVFHEANNIEMKPVYKQMLQCKPLKLSSTDGFFVTNETGKSQATTASHSPPLYDFYTCRFYDSSESSTI